ncbi:MAG: LysR family transcriptional regulator [Brachymonas sp.]|nr:LysR family transcriptional regulator [Brachymonas sp.]
MSIAKTQYKLSATDLETLLALNRTGTLAGAGEQLGQDGSTVFRAVQRLEKGMGMRLYERSRSGFKALELAQELAKHAEQIEAQLEAARTASQASTGQIGGSVRITTTDTVLHGLVAPALKTLREQHPLLNYDLHTGNELASLTRRDADIAVRATRRPPAHLIGKQIGPIRVALYAAKRSKFKRFDAAAADQLLWIAPDDALPEHPSVVWRKKHFPKLMPSYRVNSILTVAELVALGMGVGLLPMFLAEQRTDLRALTEEIEACQTQLWLLTHTETRHLSRVTAVYGHLSKTLSLI